MIHISRWRARLLTSNTILWRQTLISVIYDQLIARAIESVHRNLVDSAKSGKERETRRETQDIRYFLFLILFETRCESMQEATKCDGMPRFRNCFEALPPNGPPKFLRCELEFLE